MTIHEEGAALLVQAGGSAWAMLPERFEALTIAAPKMFTRGAKPSKLRAEYFGGAGAPGASRAGGAVAVMPIRGTIGQRRGWCTDTSTDAVGRALDDLIANSSVGKIILDIDSPGGTVAGVSELADHIRALRGQKPIEAIANSLAASAAYWIGSAASKFFVTPSGQVGSIGVWSAHIDASRALDRMGYRVSLIHAGKYKVEGNPYEPLDDEARAAMQAEVDAYYDHFIDAVAKGRGVTKHKARTGFGEGRVVLARDALKAGMVDGIMTLRQLVSFGARPAAGGSAATRLLEMELMLEEEYIV